MLNAQVAALTALEKALLSARSDGRICSVSTTIQFVIDWTTAVREVAASVSRSPVISQAPDNGVDVIRQWHSNSPEPDPDVTTVRDRDDDVWTRIGPNAWSTDESTHGEPWTYLRKYAPLTEVK